MPDRAGFSPFSQSPVPDQSWTSLVAPPPERLRVGHRPNPDPLPSRSSGRAAGRALRPPVPPTARRRGDGQAKYPASGASPTYRCSATRPPLVRSVSSSRRFSLPKIQRRDLMGRINRRLVSVDDAVRFELRVAGRPVGPPPACSRFCARAWSASPRPNHAGRVSPPLAPHAQSWPSAPLAKASR